MAATTLITVPKGKAVASAISFILNLVSQILAILWVAVKFVAKAIAKFVAWYLPRFGMGTGIGIGIIGVGMYWLPKFSRWVIGDSATGVSLRCGNADQPPDAECSYTTDLVNNYVATQSPTGNVLEPLHHEAVRNFLATWNDYAAWLPLIVAAIVFAFIMKRSSKIERPSDLKGRKAHLNWFAGAMGTFAFTELVPQLRPHLTKIAVGAFTVLVLANPLLTLTTIDSAKAAATEYVEDLVFPTQATTVVAEANEAWTETEYAKDHMGDSYAAQTTEAGRQSVLVLAQANRMGMLTPEQKTAYDAIYPFHADGNDQSQFDQNVASLHRQSLGFQVGALTSINRIASGAITWLLLALPIVFLLPRKFRKVIPMAALLTIGTQLGLSAVTRSDAWMSLNDGFTGLSALSFSIIITVAVPTLFFVMMNIVTRPESVKEEGTGAKIVRINTLPALTGKVA